MWIFESGKKRREGNLPLPLHACIYTELLLASFWWLDIYFHDDDGLRDKQKRSTLLSFPTHFTIFYPRSISYFVYFHRRYQSRLYTYWLTLYVWEGRAIHRQRIKLGGKKKKQEEYKMICGVAGYVLLLFARGKFSLHHATS